VEQAGGSIQLQQPQHPKQQSLNSSSEHLDAHPQQHQHQQQSLGQLSAKDGVSAIHAFMSFLLSLTHADEDGRVILEPPAPHTPATTQQAPQQQAPGAAATAVPARTVSSVSSNRSSSGQLARGGQLRYVLLNAARHFGQLLASARSVLLVSGTLAPIEGLAAQLFPNVAPQRIRHFECAHVVPPEQLLTVSIGRGPSGRALNLKHEARGEAGVMQELGQLLVNLCAVVLQGLVVFVPSFGYLEQLVGQWQASGLWARLNSRKPVFRCAVCVSVYL
jgi:chromosome transmission fidelity protein 1